MPKWLVELRGWLVSLVIAVIFTLLIGIFIIQPTNVSGRSMDPTLHDGQRIFISKLSHTFNRMPDYGDIVVIDSRVNQPRTLINDFVEHPLLALLFGKDDRIMYVKRVIGKPGDTLEFRDKKVFRNGAPLEEPYLNEPMHDTTTEPIIIPDNTVYVMGDNRNHSRDSRRIGPVPVSHVLGIKW